MARAADPLAGWLGAVRAVGTRSAVDDQAGEGVDGETAAGRERAAVLATVAAALADSLDVTLPGGLRLLRLAPPGVAAVPAVPPGLATPHLLGRAHEVLLDPGQRHRLGAHYTPAATAHLLAKHALDASAPRGATTTVCDPAVGGGAFLLAVADLLADPSRTRATRRQIVEQSLFGADIDPLALAVAEASLALWAGDGSAPPQEALLLADALTLEPSAWGHSPARGFDAIVGNPPFLSQLSPSTARSRSEARRVRDRLGAAASGYADAAALFLLLAFDLVRPGGAVVLVQPESFLAARDAGGVREVALERAVLRSLWMGGSGVFGAGVRVCAPVLVAHAAAAPSPAAVKLLDRDGNPCGEEPAPPDGGGSWAALAATAAGVPRVSLGGHGELGDRCRIAADFRDEYYGLVPLVAEATGAAGELPLVTSGLIDPAVCRWGERAARFGRRVWQAPAVMRSELEAGHLADWAQRRLVPKLLVATQTRVLEAVVDEEGRWLPCTPVLSVACPAGWLWHAAAVVLAPPVTAWALREAGGSALSSGAVKVSASQLRRVPLPAAGEWWDRAAAAVRRASAAVSDAERNALLVEAGRAANLAYGVTDDGLLAWWEGRLPT